MLMLTLNQFTIGAHHHCTHTHIHLLSSNHQLCAGLFYCCCCCCRSCWWWVWLPDYHNYCCCCCRILGRQKVDWKKKERKGKKMNRDWQICNSQLSRLCLLPPLLAIVVCSLSLLRACICNWFSTRYIFFALAAADVDDDVAGASVPNSACLRFTCAHLFFFLLLPSRGNGAAVAVAAVGKHVNFDKIINTFLFL